jgi:hypothetical protein
MKDQIHSTTHKTQNTSIDRVLGQNERNHIIVSAIGLRRQWAFKSLNTFAEALEAFRTAVSFRFFQWLKKNLEKFKIIAIFIFFASVASLFDLK